jgi:hypothetical protein
MLFPIQCSYVDQWRPAEELMRSVIVSVPDYETMQLTHAARSLYRQKGTNSCIELVAKDDQRKNENEKNLHPSWFIMEFPSRLHRSITSFQ